MAVHELSSLYESQASEAGVTGMHYRTEALTAFLLSLEIIV